MEVALITQFVTHKWNSDEILLLLWE